MTDEAISNNTSLYYYRVIVSYRDKRFKKKYEIRKISYIENFQNSSQSRYRRREVESSRVEPTEPERRRSGKIGTVREIAEASRLPSEVGVYTVDRE